MMNVSRRHTIAGLGAAAAAAALASSRTARADTADPPTYRTASDLVQALAARQISPASCSMPQSPASRRWTGASMPSSYVISSGRDHRRQTLMLRWHGGNDDRCSGCR